MNIPRWAAVLLILPALVLIALLTSVFFLVLSLFPPLVSGWAFGLMAVVAAWLFFRRRHSGPVSESSLMGRQSAKDGLL